MHMDNRLLRATRAKDIVSGIRGAAASLSLTQCICTENLATFTESGCDMGVSLVTNQGNTQTWLNALFWSSVVLTGNRTFRQAPVQYILCGFMLDDSGEWIDLESLYNINGHKGEVVVFHFDKDEGGKLLKEMNRTRNMKLNEREEHEGEPVITFSDGVSLTLSQYDEYLKQQNAWIDSLPEITPEDGELYDYWISLQDEVAKENGETDGDGLPKAAAVGKDSFLFV